jgi:hypothetical protein
MMQFTLCPTIAPNNRIRQFVVQLFDLKHVLVNDVVHTVSNYRIQLSYPTVVCPTFSFKTCVTELRRSHCVQLSHLTIVFDSWLSNFFI